jgi:CheY-like chemotaxis protein
MAEDALMKTGSDMNTEKKTILLVEDEAGNREILDEILSDLGYEVIDAADGSSALSTIQHGAHIDLVLTDYRLPDMTGLDVVRALRKALPHLPVIMLTAYGNIESYFESLSLGVFEYIHKPVDKRDLERIVQMALRAY